MSKNLLYFSLNFLTNSENRVSATATSDGLMLWSDILSIIMYSQQNYRLKYYNCFNIGNNKKVIRFNTLTNGLISVKLCYVKNWQKLNKLMEIKTSVSYRKERKH